MTVKDYLMIENNVVTNVCAWDGNTSSWQPPKDATMLVKADTYAFVWEFDAQINDYALSKVLGVGDIGFTYDGKNVTTNQPKPDAPNLQDANSIVYPTA